MMRKTAERLMRKAAGIRLNNAGMSLVEVIVAVMILSMTAIPVMHSLTTAAYYNLKARNRQNVTFAAESLMEAFKGYDIFDSEHPLTSPDAPDIILPDANKDTLEWLFSGKGDSKETLRAMLGAVEIGEPSAVFSGPQPQTAEFTIPGMKTEDGRTYYVRIKAGPRKENNILELENFSDETDAVYIGETAKEDELIEFIKNDFLDNYCKQEQEDAGKSSFWKAVSKVDMRGEELTTSEIGDALDGYLRAKSREVTYIVGDKDSDGVADVRCEVKYKYGIDEIPCRIRLEEASSEPDTESGGSGGIQIEKNPEEGIVPPIDNYEIKNIPIDELNLDDALKKQLKGDGGWLTTKADEYKEGGFDQQKDTSRAFDRLFIYYYPEYKLSAAGWDGGFKDSIIIKNEPDISFDCYLIKQRTADLGTATLKNRDRDYKVEVKAESNGDKIRLFHNLYENIGGGTAPSEGNITINSFAGNEAYNSEKASKKNKALVYSLTIEIMENDENGRVVSSLEGTMNEQLVNF